MAVGVSEQGYEEIVRGLSEASVRKNFDAFEDIAWDDPAYAVVPNDPRWILPRADALGATEWYRSLPQERQIEIGLYRWANIAKVGLQFEQLLIGGLMQHLFAMPNGRSEFRYSTHEATEECHHTQMFQEFVNRSGVDVPGGPTWFKKIYPIVPLFGGWTPFFFFVMVLGGEEPIDYLQKSILREGADLHPLMVRIMQIHVAEEARHIGFAHHYLEHQARELGPIRRAVLSVLTPLVFRVMLDIIMKPSRQVRRDLGLPRSVVKDVWWRSEASQKLKRDTFADVRSMAEATGLMNPVSRRVWRLFGIDGRTSRFRSEPSRAAA